MWTIQKKVAAALQGPVIVTRTHTLPGYYCARALSDAGVPVVAMSPSGAAFAKGLSNLVGSGIYPLPFIEPKAFIEAVKATAANTSASMILPTCEEVFVLASNEADFTNGVRLLASPFNHLLKLHDKSRLPLIAARAGVATPETHSIRKFDSRTLDQIAKLIRPPFVIKRIHGSGNFGTRFVKNDTDLKSAVVSPDLQWPCIVQRMVPGDVFSVGAVKSGPSSGGRIVAMAVLHDLRAIQPEGGLVTARKIVTDPGIEDAASRVLAAASAVGAIHLEFIRDRSGGIHLIEINPRLWGGVATAIYSGLNIPLLLVASELNVLEPGESVVRPKLGITGIWVAGELRRIAAYLSRRQPLRALSALREFSSVLRSPDSIADEFADGLWPAAQRMWGQFSFFLARNKNDVRSRERTAREMMLNGFGESVSNIPD